MKSNFSFEAIGTHWQIAINDPLSQKKQKELLGRITNRIDQFDKTYSRFREDSLVNRMAQKKGMYTLPEDAKTLLTLYKNLYEITNHAFTPFIGSVLVDAGYDATYSLVPKTLRQPHLWEDAIEYHHPRVTIKKPVLLDFGAAGKGYLIDIIGSLLQKNSIESYIIDAGGDMLYKNPLKKKLRIGLEHPDHSDQVIGVATIIGGSICCSAGNRRRWKNFHHIINPLTLSSPAHILSTWAIAKTACITDAIATALFFVPAKTLFSHFEFSYALMYADYSLEASRDFPGEFFTKD